MSAATRRSSPAASASPASAAARRSPSTRRRAASRSTASPSREGQVLTIDGSSGTRPARHDPRRRGRALPGAERVPRAGPTRSRRLKVRTNADTPPTPRRRSSSAPRASASAAPSTCSSPKDRLPVVREMLLAASDAKTPRGRGARRCATELENATGEKKRAARGAPQRRARPHGRPDGPLPRRAREDPADAAGRLRGDLPRHGRQARDHPPHRPADARVPPRPRRAARRRHAPPHHRRPTRRELREKEAMLAAVNAMREQNPMLGLRGCRLGILYPEINEMQVQAIFRAALKLAARGHRGAAGGDDPARRLRDRAARTCASCSRRTARKEMETAGTPDQLPVRHDDRAAARRPHRRRDRQAPRSSSRSARTTSRRRRSASAATTPRASSSRSTCRWASSRTTRSRPSTRSASAPS